MHPINLSRLYRDLIGNVTFEDPSTVYVEKSTELEIGDDTVVEPCVKLTGKIKIGKNCRIFFGFKGHNLECGDNCELGGMIFDSKFGDDCHVGEFAEIKRSEFGNNVNCLHHCYIGDANVGDGVNIGAGVITANYDGKKKNKTFIMPGAFIGVNSNLIAPMEVGPEAFVAAGSTISGYIPANALAISRTPQTIKENFWQKTGKIWQKIKP